jgi:serine/threonine-protein kinase RsbW
MMPDGWTMTVPDVERLCWVRSAADGRAAVGGVADEMASAGYAEGDVFAVRLSLEEAIHNALRHGNCHDPSKRVRVSYWVTAERVLVEVEDEGEGFDPGKVPDPRAPENLERFGGRGLFLMRAYLTWVRHNGRGNCVSLCKCRSAHLAGLR